MKQRIFSHFQDYLIQYISHQYQDLLYCNSSQYILSAYNSQHNNNNNVVLAMTMPYSGQGWRHSALPFGSRTMSSTLTTILAYSLLTQHYYINNSILTAVVLSQTEGISAVGINVLFIFIEICQESCIFHNNIRHFCISIQTYVNKNISLKFQWNNFNRSIGILNGSQSVQVYFLLFVYFWIDVEDPFIKRGEPGLSLLIICQTQAGDHAGLPFAHVVVLIVFTDFRWERVLLAKSFFIESDKDKFTSALIYICNDIPTREDVVQFLRELRKIVHLLMNHIVTWYH
jgi:hypothetical protein